MAIHTIGTILERKKYSLREEIWVVVDSCYGPLLVNMEKVIWCLLNAAQYQEMLQRHLVHVGHMIGGREWIFQQNNAPIRRAKVNHSWFKAKKITVI